MSTLTDAKLAALQTLTGGTGHIQDLELQYLLLLVTGPVTAGTIVDLWNQVFDEASIAAGQHNDRWMAYMDFILAPATQDHYNEREREYWDNGGTPIGPVGPQPPGTPLLWYDFTDASQVFNDTAGTIPAVDGDDIRRMNDKGTANEPILDAGGGVIYQTNVINGLNVALTTSLQALSDNFGFGTTGTGWTFACVAKHDGAATQQKVFSWETNRQLQQDSLGSGNWEGITLTGPTTIDSGAPVVEGEFIGGYMKNNNSLDFDIRFSGQAQVDGLSPSFLNVGAFENFQMGVFDGQIAEVIVYETFLDATDSQALMDYFDAKYGTLPQAVLPDQADLIHWFDFTDPLTVFRNPPATQLALDGDFIRNVTNKGTDGTAISSPSTGVSPILRTGIINGLQIADYNGTSKLLDAVVAAGQSSSINGLSMALVFRWKAGPAATNSMTDWGSNLGRTTATRFGQWFVAGAPGNVSSLGALGADTWYLGAFAFDGPGAGTDRWQWSGEAVQTAILGFLSDIAPGSTIEIANAATTIEVAEFAVWDGQLTATEFAQLFTYADAKYGTLPIFAPPLPALGSLTHHVDPSDASTVWADAAATIPAIDGGTVDRIDNKGTDGTPLASVTGTPIYRTGLLNGQNIIEFSSANLTALAVTAGLTISTTGYTIAMVTRRRASHFGDSILWRWTPFVGTPGPSLRGRFSLNGNFHRADPLADEDLVANPSVIDQWYLLYFSNDAAGAVDDAKFGSPGPEVAGPFGVATDIAAGSDVRFGTSSTFVEHAEAWFWNRPLTLAERAQLVAYADAKYGTLPHL